MLEQPAISESKKRTRKRIVLFICIFIFLFVVGPMLTTAAIYNRTFGQRAESPEHRVFLNNDDAPEYMRRVVNFPSGSNMLTGYIYGEDNYQGLVVIAHSFGDGAEGYFSVIRYFVDNGWRVFAHDNTGSHNSEGRSTRGLPQSALDLDAALTFISEQEWELPIMLFGHSWGGFAVTAVLNFDHEISAVVSLAGYNRSIQVLHDTARAMFGWSGNLAYPYLWAYQRLLFGRNADLSAVDGINNSDVPVMIIHGTADGLILYDSAGIIAHRDEIINPNVIFITHYLAHHNGHMNLLLTEEAAAYISELDEVFRDLLHRYIPEQDRHDCPFVAVYFHHVNMLTNRNIARCFCSRVYNVFIPDDALFNFYANIDRYQTSALNLSLMDEINAFFKKSLLVEKH